MTTEVLLGQWLPDGPDYKNPGLTVCDGCYPRATGYGPLRSATGSGLSVSGPIRGAARYLRSNGQVVLVIGTDTDLYTVVGGVLQPSNISVNLAPNVFWSFEQFGTQIWAFAYNVAPHYITDIETVSTFSPHPGIAPQAANGNRVGDFMVTANMVDIDSSVAPYRIRWSKFNDPAGDYGTDIASQSGFVDMPQDFGPVIGVYGGRYNVVLQKYGVSRLAYTGGASAFSKDVIEEGSGCISATSVVTVAGDVYFLSSTGFMVTNGTSVAPISTGRVWEWFQDQADTSALESVQGAVNWETRTISWSFIEQGKSGYTRQIIYSWDHDRWSTSSFSVDWMFASNGTGISLEQLDAIYPNLDEMPVSMDGPQFKARDRVFSAIIDGEYVTMDGDIAEAVWETGEFQPKTGYRTCTREVRPLIENQNANTQLAVGVREVNKGDTVSWSRDTPVGSAGFAPIIKDGRYMRARMKIPSGGVWNKAIGLQVDFAVTGRT